MRVFEINSYASLSTGTITKQIGEAVLEDGGIAEIAYGRGDFSSRVPSYQITGTIGFLTDVFLTRLTDRAGFYSTHQTKKLIQEIEDFSPDIIHLHNLHDYYINVRVLFRYLQKKNIPVVWTLHDCWAYTGHCCHYTVDQCYGWQHDGFCNNIHSYPRSWFYNNSKRNFKAKRELFTSLDNLTLAPVSNWLGKELDKSFLSKIPKVVIPNGVETKTFKPTESNIRTKLGLKTNEKMILSVASTWSIEKGLADLETLAAELKDQAKVVLVGLSKSQIADLPQGMIGIERTQNIHELVELYSAADVYVNASLEESFGLTTVEAMACGTTVAVYDSTAIPEVVEPGCGAIFKPHDIDALALFIKSSEFEQINQRARKRAEHYTVSRQNEGYLSLYRRLLKQNQKY